MNRVKTYLLLTALTAALIATGDMVAGRAGAIAALALAIALNACAYWFSAKFVLRTYDARPMEFVDTPSIHRMVQHLAHAAGTPMPRLYVIPEAAPNAFATGRDSQHSAIAFTDGLLQLLSPEEIEAVAAHEIAHIRKGDTLLKSVTAAIAGAVSSVAHFALWGTLSNRSAFRESATTLASALVRFTASPEKEFTADEAAAKLTGNPQALASALRKIVASNAKTPMYAGGPETAHVFLHPPFGLEGLCGTHPCTEERIRRLMEMAAMATPQARQAS